MIFRFEQMIPLPLLEQDTAGSEVWEADSLLLEQGKSYVIEAPSGRGKTSLLSVMYGIRTDYEGEVFMDDRNIKSFTWREWSALRKKRLSVIFQGLELFDDLSTLENIQLACRRCNRDKGGKIPEPITLWLDFALIIPGADKQLLQKLANL